MPACGAPVHDEGRPGGGQTARAYSSAAVSSATVSRLAGRRALLAARPALLRVDLLAVLLGQPAPDAVRLADREAVLAALLEHRAARADLHGGLVALAARGATLTLGVEEQARVRLAAGALELPFPHLGHGDGKTGELCHGEPPGSDPTCGSVSDDQELEAWRELFNPKRAKSCSESCHGRAHEVVHAGQRPGDVRLRGNDQKPYSLHQRVGSDSGSLQPPPRGARAALGGRQQDRAQHRGDQRARRPHPRRSRAARRAARRASRPRTAGQSVGVDGHSSSGVPIRACAS